ncbi:MAG: carbohydrate-binding protein [Bacteroidetes bacterium]|nr:carbohydrate-binding protein [Bacteroidota bacterium]
MNIRMTKLTKILFLCSGLLLISTIVLAQGLKTSGKKIVDQNGNEVILRGMGLGGWMIQEGYMMETSNFAGSQHEIKAKIQSLVGPENTATFYKTWHQNHCTRRDIDSLASWGFNSIRVPMHYNLFTLPVESEPVADSNTWLEEGFVLTDSLVKWCSADHIYIILDLHAAPGGQGRDANISDYDPSKPSLWENQANKNKTIALWKRLAERYANEPWIGGYDLINETNWNFTAGANQNGCDETTNAPLRQLLIAITTAIREVDTHHIIFIEGNCWANNYNGILPSWDNNLVVSFHKYWSYNDLGSIQGMLNIRNNFNVPLWLGESGENSNAWFTEAIQLLEKNSIGWSWWPLKKVSSVVGPYTIPKNTGYQTLLDYWQNGGTTPTSEFAMNALMQLAENAKPENCIYRKDVIDAMFRQVSDTNTKPFSHQAVPGIIHASDYDLGRYGSAYFDKDIADYHVTTGTYTAWNNGWTYRNDGVDLETSFDSDPGSNGINIGWTQDNEWTQYSVNVDSSAVYTIKFRYAYASGTAAKIRLISNGRDVSPLLALTATGGNQTWNYLTINDIVLYKGLNKIRVYFEKGGANFGFMKFTLSKKISDMGLLPVTGETSGSKGLILVTFNKFLDPQSVNLNGFSCLVNGNPVSIKSISLNTKNTYQVFFELETSIYDGDTISFSYQGGSIKAGDGMPLSDFNNLIVDNLLPVHYSIPGKIEAESFVLNRGLQLESTTDLGGGQDIGYTNTGDYLEYNIRVKKKARYKLEVRVACQSKSGTVEFQQIDTTGTELHSVDLSVPVTGGWQTWTTTSSSVNLEAGIGTLRVKIIAPEFNMNWYRFTEIIKDTSSNEKKEIRLYPNPLHDGVLTIEIPDSKGMNKRLIIHSTSGALCLDKELNSSDETYRELLGNLAPGFYIVELRINESIRRTKFLVI